MRNTLTVRIPETLKKQAQAYSDNLGISLNALINVSLDEYLNSRQSLKSDNKVEIEPDSSKESIKKDIPRNAPCPCGSGKKYKRCCGA